MNGPSERAGTWLAAAAAVVLHLGALRGGFVSDDATYVTGHPGVAGDAPIFSRATPPDRPELGLYRPLTTLTYRWTREVFGFAADRFHAVDLVLHAACAALVVILAGRLGASPRGRLCAGLAFAVLPVHVEAVAWITGRAELLAAALALAALIAFSRPDGRAPFLRACAAAVLYAAACLAKESALPLPLALFCLDALAPGRSTRGVRIARVVPSLVALAAIVAVRIAVLGRFGPDVVGLPAPFTIELADRARLAVATFGIAWQRVFVPIALSIFPDPREFAATSALWLGAALLVASTALVVRAVRRARSSRAAVPAAAVGVVLFAIFLMPFLQLVPIGSLLADRFLYLPSVGLSIAFGALAFPTDGRGARVRGWIAAAIVLAFALLSVRRVPAFHDDVALWEDAARARPDAAIPAFVLGEKYREAGLLASRGADSPGAVEMWTRSLENDPHHEFAALAHLRLGEISAAAGDAPSAAGHYRLAIAIDQNLVPALVDLATLHRARPPVLAPDEAERLLARARAATNDAAMLATIAQLEGELRGP